MTNGAILVGAGERQSEDKFFAVEAATGARLPQGYSSASRADVSAACALAEQAFAGFSTLKLEERARFLEAIAANVGAVGDIMITTAMAETGLPRGRLEGERDRTINQLKMFASFVRQGDWLDVTIDPALPDRKPAARPDLRRMNVALGPVAVFGASNFPLAFSVAGGDTAAAFAAGCPVVVKGHPAHPGTGELVARAIVAAVAGCGLPDGVFSYLPGASHELGAALIADPRIKAVGFTGSRAGGLALMRIAAQRPEPIPVFAEMSSVNPVVILPAALAARSEVLATGFVQSLTLGAGQFCTNPGVVFTIGGAGFDSFMTEAAKALGACSPAVMLSPDIRTHFLTGVQVLTDHPDVTLAGRGGASANEHGVRGALFVTDALAFLEDQKLSHEVFGAAGIIVKCRDLEEISQCIGAMEGQLTATLQFDDEDRAAAARLLPELQKKVGRVLANGWPTGVEVTHAMVHGGPFPATSDGRSTSVGTLAMMRFLRPVCFQNLPDEVLPPPLQNANPWRLARRIDGVMDMPR